MDNFRKTSESNTDNWEGTDRNSIKKKYTKY